MRGITETIKSIEPVTTQALAKILCQSVATTSRLLKAAESDGLVTCRRRGRSTFWLTVEPVEPVKPTDKIQGETVTAIIHDDAPAELTDEPDSLGESEDDPRVWVARRGGRKLGEIAEIRAGDRVRYQIISPWEATVYEALSDAFGAFGGLT